jgi:hypothetical protein
VSELEMWIDDDLKKNDLDESANECETIKREERYLVVKRKYLTESQYEDLEDFVDSLGISTTGCVVIETDWPEYEPVWSMLEKRINKELKGKG